MVLLQASFIARLMSYWRFYWCAGVSLQVRFFISVLFGGYFLCLVMLLLGLVSAESRPQVQLIRAELSSNGSSEPRSESLSKLSSHQIPHSLGSEGTTTAKGLYAYSFFCVLNHYAFGRQSAGTVSACALHSDHGVEQACSAAARVPPRSPCPGHLLLPPLAVWLIFLYEAFPHGEGRCPRIHVFCGSAFPSRGSTASSLSSSMRAIYVQGGGRMCFPVRDCRCLLESHSVSLRSCPFVPRSFFLSGRPDVFFRSRLSTTSSPLLSSPTLLLFTSSRSARMVSTDTVFGVVRAVSQFKA